jgi:hypothetical protein
MRDKLDAVLFTIVICGLVVGFFVLGFYTGEATVIEACKKAGSYYSYRMGVIDCHERKPEAKAEARVYKM